MKTFLLILFVWTLNSCVSQHQIKTNTVPDEIKFPIKISGVVKDSVTKEGLVQCSLYTNKFGRSDKGAQVNYDGSFNLIINKNDLQDSLLCFTIQAFGYYGKHFDLIINKCFINKPLIILLTEIPPSSPDAKVNIIAPRSTDKDMRAIIIGDSLRSVEMHKYIQTLPPCK